MQEKHEESLTRRRLLGVSLGSAGALLSYRALGQSCQQQPTGAQALGPFFPRPSTPIDMTVEQSDPRLPLHLANDNDLTYVNGREGHAAGQVVYIKGRVLNASCQAISNASLVIWQASESGRYNHVGDGNNEVFHHPKTGLLVRRELDPFFQYWGRTVTNQRGEYLFKTIVPGFYPADLASAWFRPPHIHFLVSALGYQQLVTQTYFRGEQLADNDWYQELNQQDLLLQSPSLSSAEREGLIIDFEPSDEAAFSDGLVGTLDITLRR